MDHSCSMKSTCNGTKELKNIAKFATTSRANFARAVQWLGCPVCDEVAVTCPISTTSNGKRVTLAIAMPTVQTQRSGGFMVARLIEGTTIRLTLKPTRMSQ